MMVIFDLLVKGLLSKDNCLRISKMFLLEKYVLKHEFFGRGVLCRT